MTGNEGSGKKKADVEAEFERRMGEAVEKYGRYHWELVEALAEAAQEALTGWMHQKGAQEQVVWLMNDMVWLYICSERLRWVGKLSTWDAQMMLEAMPDVTQIVKMLGGSFRK